MNASSNGRLKGIYKRGKKFWFRYSLDGHQTRVPLDTEDEGEAVTRALRIRGNPLLAADPLAEELEILTAGTVAEYQDEVARRAAARQVQIAGMVKTALPVGGRTQENIGATLKALGETAGKSIAQLQVQIRQQVSLLNLGAGGEAGAAG
jgi:hypothetical protein